MYCGSVAGSPAIGMGRKMKNLSLENIAAACGGRLFCNGRETAEMVVSDIVTDNRKVTKDALFVAIKGNRVDGHDFIPSAYEAGACCVISEKIIATEKAFIVVDNSLLAIKKIAAFYREQLDIKVVGITGSVGKTSTKEMIYSVLAEKYNVLKTEGNFNNELGLPLTVFRIRDEHEIAVLEMGISDFGEMTRLSEIAKPDVSVITNIGLCHLENLKSRDGILKAKTEMFLHLSENGTIILNGDDDKLITVKDYNGIKPVFYHVHDAESHEMNINDAEMENTDGEKYSNGSKIYADNIISDGIKGIRCTLHYNDSSIDVKINIPGKHMVYNAMAAMCVGKTFALSDEEIKRGIEKLRPVNGRNNMIERNGITIIDDCYNANPVSMKAGIDVLSHADNRRVAVLGDMGELGTNEQMLHIEIGRYLADSNIDVIVLCGRLMNNAYTYLLENSNNKKLYYFDKIEDLISELERIIRQNDTILVKASHSMEFNKIIEKLI